MLYVMFKRQPPEQLKVGESFIDDDLLHFFDLRCDTYDERERAKAEGYRYAYLFVEGYGYYGDTRYVFIGFEVL